MKMVGSSAVALAMGGAKIPEPKKKQEQPNIVFIFSDDHDCQAISGYGYDLVQTPNLDRLASEGMRFEHCMCTNSICAPSRAVVLTGKYSHINGVIDNVKYFDGSQQTFPKLLQQAGYETAMIGKWHLKSEPTGFDYYQVLPGQGEYYNPEFVEMGKRKIYRGYVTDIITELATQWLDQRPKNKPFCLMYQHKAPHRKWWPGPDKINNFEGVRIQDPPPTWDDFYNDYPTRSDAASEQEMTVAYEMNMMDVKIEKPKPLDVSKLPGWPKGYEPKVEAYKKPWTEAEKINWKNGRFKPNFPNGLDEEQMELWESEYRPKREYFQRAKLKGKELYEWKWHRYMEDYLRCVKGVDDNVGKILDYLDEKGLAENTIVVYSSDQGFYLGNHGWFDKRFMYEQSLHMPLIVRYPKKVPAGKVNDDIVLNIDFAPTLLDYAGANVPSDIQGESMLPVLAGETPANWRESMYYHYYEYPAVHMVKRHYGVRTKRYKLIHFYYDIDAWELYDLEKDPHELNNVYAKDEYKDVQERLHRELRRLRAKYKDSDELTQTILKPIKDRFGKKVDPSERKR
jgi:arylsulfatase A-like enzyme